MAFPHNNHMDALLQLIVPKIVETEELKIEQQIYELDGVQCPSGEARVSWRGLALHFDEKTPYLANLLPRGYIGQDWAWLKVPDDLLERYDLSVKNGLDLKDQVPLEDLLRALLSSLDRWVLAFILHYDQIDTVDRMGVEQVIHRLRTNLQRNQETEGFVSYA